MTSETTWRTAGWQMPVTTGDQFAEFTTTSTIGVVSGVYSGSVRAAVGMGAAWSSLGKTEIPEMTTYLTQARQEALVRCVAAAKHVGANALVGVRFESNAHGDSGTMDVHCWGTAVVVS